MRAFLLHVWLLLSLRHPGTGLPRSFRPVLAVMVVASVVASLRWEVLYEPYQFARAIELFVIGLALFFWLLLLVFISPAFAAAFAMVSIAADVITIVLALVGLFSGNARLALLFLETVALSRIGVLLYLNAGDSRRG